MPKAIRRRLPARGCARSAPPICGSRASRPGCPHRLRRPRFGPAAANPETAGNSGLDPFQLLGSALDRMVAAGVLLAARRPGAEYLAWSAVHGLAMLVIEGPLRTLPRAQTAVIEDHLLAMVERACNTNGR